jgi:hypothetical protein
MGAKHFEHKFIQGKFTGKPILSVSANPEGGEIGISDKWVSGGLDFKADAKVDASIKKGKPKLPNVKARVKAVKKLSPETEVGAEVTGDTKEKYIKGKLTGKTEIVPGINLSGELYADTRANAGGQVELGGVKEIVPGVMLTGSIKGNEKGKVVTNARIEAALEKVVDIPFLNGTKIIAEVDHDFFTMFGQSEGGKTPTRATIGAAVNKLPLGLPGNAEIEIDQDGNWVAMWNIIDIPLN